MKVLSIALTLAFVTIAGVQAADVAMFATATETIETGGPSGSPWFHNAQGNDDGYAEFGAADFTVTKADFGFANDVADITGMSVTYRQSNTFFTSDGDVAIWLADDSPAFADLSYDDTANPGGVSTDAGLQGLGIAPLTTIGSGSFVEESSGDADVFTLSLDATAEQALIDAINAGEGFRLVMAADELGTAATYAGVGNFDYDAPQVSISATQVPEPATLTLLGLGAVALIRRRRSA